MVDFVVYVPRYLPPGCGVSDAVVVPDRRESVRDTPGQVYMRLGDKMALWEMARSPALIPHNLQGVARAGDTHVWMVGPSKGDFRTITWTKMGTQFGLTGKYKTEQLLRVAASMAPAAPRVTPRQLLEEDRLPPGGIGAVLWLFGEHFVDEVTEGFPAHTAGIETGDELVAVDGRPVGGLGPAEIIGLVRGRVGSKVRITFRRGNMQFTRALVRAAIPNIVSFRRPLDEAIKSMQFRVLIPKWVPELFQLSEVAVSTLRPNPRKEGPQLELIYTSTPGSFRRGPSITITQKKARGSAPPPAKRYARIGNRQAAVYVGPFGTVRMRWIADGIQVTLQSAGVAFEDLIRVATSMR